MRKKRTLGTMVTTGFMATAIAMTAFMAGCSAQAAGDTEEQEHAGETDSSGTAGELEDVTVILDYVANTNHTGMYVALEKGYYEEEGLKVSIIEPTQGATATLIAVGKGRCH